MRATGFNVDAIHTPGAQSRAAAQRSASRSGDHVRNVRPRALAAGEGSCPVGSNGGFRRRSTTEAGGASNPNGTRYNDRIDRDNFQRCLRFYLRLQAKKCRRLSTCYTPPIQNNILLTTPPALRAT
jgi:hypothetical protein